jgi:hypothetical protein
MNCIQQSMLDGFIFSLDRGLAAANQFGFVLEVTQDGVY